IYSQVERRLKSGRSRNDQKSCTKLLTSWLKLNHCWGILKETPKWKETQQEHKLKAKKTNTLKDSSKDQSRLLPTDITNPSSPPPQEELAVENKKDKENHSLLFCF
ncbi:uncharacterized protein VP01_1662g4, partial [Puccinia sorghi]